MGLSPSTRLSPEEKAAYLRDARPFAVKDAAIQKAAHEATAGRASDVAKLEGIHDFVIAHLRYSRDGRWDPAPVVLASGKGSCSEYTYLFVALCRAAGIPARYVGGITGRAGKPLYVDLVYHRFAQAFVEGIGWVDFDPTRDRRSKSHRVYFGRTSGPILLLCAGDGRGSLTGWDYRSLILWKGKGEDEDDDSPRAPNYAATVVVQVGWWLPQPPAEIRRKVAAFRKLLAETPPPQRRSLIAEALKIGHPYVLPWLDDLLYDPSTRVEAARAFRKSAARMRFWPSSIISAARTTATAIARSASCSNALPASISAAIAKNGRNGSTATRRRWCCRPEGRGAWRRNSPHLTARPTSATLLVARSSVRSPNGGRRSVLAKLRGLKPRAMASYKVKELGMFGSFARGEQSDDSDIDVLVEFEEGRRSLRPDGPDPLP